jgi:hypothetical protein
MDLLQLATAGWLSKSLAVAARLGIADLLENGPLTNDEIAAATKTHADSLLRLLRMLAGFGVFRRQEDGRFANSALSETLRTSHPMSMRYFCILSGEEYDRAWDGLLHAVRTGESGFAHIFRGSIYDYMDRNPAAAEVYDRAMEDLSRAAGALLAREVDFSAVRRIVDVGGGSGIMVRQVMKAHPHVAGVVLDRDEVCRRAEGASVGAEFGGRLTFQPGDFFADVPRGADLYLLKNVLHNWNEESCLRILGAVQAAMKGSKARLLVIEPLVEPDDTSPRLLVNALFQIVMCEQGTRERTKGEMRAMLAAAGFAVVSTKALPTGHTVVEAVAN